MRLVLARPKHSWLRPFLFSFQFLSFQHLNFMKSRNKSSLSEPGRRFIALLIWCQRKKFPVLVTRSFQWCFSNSCTRSGRGFVLDCAMRVALPGLIHACSAREKRKWIFFFFLQQIALLQASHSCFLTAHITPPWFLLVLCSFMSFYWFWLGRCLHSWKLPKGKELEHLVSVFIFFSDYSKICLGLKLFSGESIFSKNEDIKKKCNSSYHIQEI